VFDHFSQLVSDASGWAYAIVFLLALIHAVVPVVPSETAVIAAGVVNERERLSRITGRMPPATDQFTPVAFGR
jgi:membrane protein DedA with SNARE-associated domain